MTPTHEVKPKSSFENLSVSFRFILPFLFAMFMYNYTQDQNRLHSEMTTIEETGKQISESLDAASRKTACINQNVAKCCPNSVVCY